MRPILLSALLCAAAACFARAPLEAQTAMPLDRGAAVEASFARQDARAGVSQTWEYARRVRRGTTLHVHVWGSFSETGTRLVPRVSISDPDAAGDDSGTTRTREYTDASITASKTFDRAGRVRITVSSGADAAGRGYTIRVEDPSTFRSATRGAQLAAGYGTHALATGDGRGDTRGQGFTLRAGAGVSRALTVFMEGGMADMTPVSSTPDAAAEAYSYRLTQAELGARLYLLGSWSRLRPFVQGGVGGRWFAVSDRPIQAGGLALVPGAGAELFLRPGLSVEGGVRRSFGEVTRWRRKGGEWTEVPDGHDLDVRATRAHLQVVLHLGERR